MVNVPSQKRCNKTSTIWDLSSNTNQEINTKATLAKVGEITQVLDSSRTTLLGKEEALDNNNPFHYGNR